MADSKLMIPHFQEFEGGYVNNKNDAGGATNRGITLKTFKQYYPDATVSDLKKITNEQWLTIFKDGYFNPFKADKIENQSLALLCVDFAFNSGSITAIKAVQKAIGTDADGIVGKKTLAKLNSNPRLAFNLIWNARYNWYVRLSNKDNNRIFLKG